MTDDLPGFVALTGQQGAGLTCTHDGAAWGSTLRCTPGGGSLAPGATVAVTLTVAATDTIPFPMPMINVADATADGGLVARARRRANSPGAWRASTMARLDRTFRRPSTPAQAPPMSSASAEAVSLNNLSLDRILTLQGGWNRTFTTRDATGYRTTLDATGQSGDDLSSDPTVEGFTVTGGQIAIASGNPILRNNVIQNAYREHGGCHHLRQCHYREQHLPASLRAIRPTSRCRSDLGVGWRAGHPAQRVPVH